MVNTPFATFVPAADNPGGVAAAAPLESHQPIDTAVPFAIFVVTANVADPAVPAVIMPTWLATEIAAEPTVYVAEA